MKTCTLVLLATVCGVSAYPQNSLKCKSTMTRPDRQSICPEARNNYCVKEVSSLPLSLCGKTQYFADSYEEGECVYKKCDSECEEGKFTFEWDSQQYTRRRYCCNDVNMCNAAHSLSPMATFNLAIAIIVLVINYVL